MSHRMGKENKDGRTAVRPRFRCREGGISSSASPVLLGCLHRPLESDWAPPRVVVVAVASSKHDVQ